VKVKAQLTSAPPRWRSLRRPPIVFIHPNPFPIASIPRQDQSLNAQAGMIYTCVARRFAGLFVRIKNEAVFADRSFECACVYALTTVKRQAFVYER
jgi:hypothetical protein